tara:strand:+ start:152 stop:694 length:543 start_codon:yes stop_codon:yes gene_type:complete
MNYENFEVQLSDFTDSRKNFVSILGLYLFSLGTLFLGYSFYLLLESIGIVEKNIISWNGQGLLWFVVLFCVSIFILFLPIEFFSVFKIYNKTFKDLILNIIFVIFTSLIFLILFQYLISADNLIIKEVVDIGKAVSFAGFIAIPLVLFLFHSFFRNSVVTNNFIYSFVLLIWLSTSQIFL